MDNQKTFETAAQQLIEHLVLSFKNRYIGNTSASQDFLNNLIVEWQENAKLVPGKVYTKVITNGSAYAFILNEDNDKFKKGDILKANSFTAPAKNKARGNIFFPESYQKMEWAGI